jgi:hypothetical protein
MPPGLARRAFSLSACKRPEQLLTFVAMCNDTFYLKGAGGAHAGTLAIGSLA